MTQEQIDKVNARCPHGQGIFFEPNGIPNHIKDLVLYSRFVKDGVAGGNCWGDKRYSFVNEPEKDHMIVLDYVLEELHPNITYLQFKRIHDLIRSNEDTIDGYYGNFENWKVDYILLPELEEFLDTLK